MLSDFLNKLLLYFFREEFGKKMKCYRRVLWNFLVQNLGRREKSNQHN